ncbi:LAME_0A02982g1_1 [Lachancea meyersii CBS 8951]|uniref:LAME_0A02982g1_1 n=1 Tax=Lachancea meyersii CBS 8951 TaxID=1266667 RepID=A0A1G4IMX8_9SACH|nr:LAME_0A02982g1_1 [Lachancea meyersii CBS 8951]
MVYLKCNLQSTCKCCDVVAQKRANNHLLLTMSKSTNYNERVCLNERDRVNVVKNSNSTQLSNLDPHTINYRSPSSSYGVCVFFVFPPFSEPTRRCPSVLPKQELYCHANITCCETRIFWERPYRDCNQFIRVMDESLDIFFSKMPAEFAGAWH